MASVFPRKILIDQSINTVIYSIYWFYSFSLLQKHYQNNINNYHISLYVYNVYHTEVAWISFSFRIQFCFWIFYIHIYEWSLFEEIDRNEKNNWGYGESFGKGRYSKEKVKRRERIKWRRERKRGNKWWCRFWPYTILNNRWIRPQPRVITFFLKQRKVRDFFRRYVNISFGLISNMPKDFRTLNWNFLKNAHKLYL